MTVGVDRLPAYHRANIEMNYNSQFIVSDQPNPQYALLWTMGGTQSALKTHTDMWRICKLHGERPQPNRDSNQQPCRDATL